MQVSELIRKAQAAELRTEMEVFLAHLLGVSRLDLIAHGEQEVPVAALASLQQAWVKMQEGYPVAYLTHEKEFYGLNFYVDERVLVPRDATERLVDYVLARPAQHVLEIGTGSGAIAVAVKKTDAQRQVSATDVSADALEVANKNCVQNEVDVNLFQSDLLQSVPAGDYDLLVANLPYIGEVENRFIAENVEAHEPHVALFGGHDGLGLYKQLFEQIRDGEWNFKWIMGEIGFTQGEGARELAAEILPDYVFELHQDYEGLDRHFILSYTDKA